MEKIDNAVVVPMDAGWSDIGAWSSLWDVSNKDDLGNVALGDVKLRHTKNSFVRANGSLVAVVGLNDVVVVSTPDAALVAHKDYVQDVKVIASELKNEERSEWHLHREVYRPWGKYDSIDRGNRHQVKRITVNPGAKLSLQMHHHRSEHWVVVSGVAKVTLGSEISFLYENQSTYIPIGEVHSLENPRLQARDN